MVYQAPKLTEVGSVESLTLGQPLPIEFDDNTWYFFYGSTPGSR